MALPASGQISLGQARAEAGLSGQVSLGQGAIRSLAGVASGTIGMSDLHGKASIQILTITPGTSGTTRGYSAGSYGSISSTTYGGRTIISVYATSGSPNILTINFNGTTNPGYTTAIVNGVEYNIPAWTINTKAGTAFVNLTVSGMYSKFSTAVTLGFK